MQQDLPPTIHNILENNNILMVVADGYSSPQEGHQGYHLADLAVTLAAPAYLLRGDQR